MSLAACVIVLEVARIRTDLVYGPNTGHGCALEFEYANRRTGKNNDVWSSSAF